MDSLKELVIFRLGQRRKKQEQAYQIKYQKEFDEISEAALHKLHNPDDTLREIVMKMDEKAKELTEEEIQEGIEELKEDIADEVGVVYAIFTQSCTKEARLEAAAKKYELIDIDAAKQQINGNLGVADELNLSQTRAAFSRAIDYHKSTHLLVNRLYDIAKEKGIEAALSDETIYSITKEIFPTKDDYLEYTANEKEVAKIALNSLGTAIITAIGDDEDCEIVAQLIFGGINNYIDDMQKIDDLFLADIAEKIYGDN